jgi:hypothetical protein
MTSMCMYRPVSLWDYMWFSLTGYRRNDGVRRHEEDLDHCQDDFISDDDEENPIADFDDMNMDEPQVCFLSLCIDLRCVLEF